MVVFHIILAVAYRSREDVCHEAALVASSKRAGLDVVNDFSLFEDSGVHFLNFLLITYRYTVPCLAQISAICSLVQ
jgi:hypothetical protein